MQNVGNRQARLPNVIFLLFSFGVLTACTPASGTPTGHNGCTVEVVSKVKSPDGLWWAYVDEYTCSDGWFVTDISDTVRLVQLHSGKQEDVFSLDSAGNPAARPVAHWVSPKVMNIDVPNKSLIGIQKMEFGGVVIHVKFHPNDPKERARWLKEIEKGP